MSLWLTHCDFHLDGQGEQIPCPGHYVRLSDPVRFTLRSGVSAPGESWARAQVGGEQS